METKRRQGATKFVGHYQPRLPGSSRSWGVLDLRLSEVMFQQLSLRRENGFIDGFASIIIGLEERGGKKRLLVRL